MSKMEILHVICQLLGGRDGFLATASLTVLFTSGQVQDVSRPCLFHVQCLIFCAWS